MDPKVKIVKVFDCMTEEISLKIKNMFLREGGLSENLLNSRISEMLFVAIDDVGNIVATCSGHPFYVKELQGVFLYYRSYTSVDNRTNGLSYDIINVCRSYFEENRMFLGQELKGIYCVFESPLLNKLKNYIIPRSGLTLIGFTDQGYQKRVRYFPDAKLS